MGPLALSADRAAVIIAVLALLAVTGLLARKAGPSIRLWASAALIVAGVCARAGFVLAHASVYLDDPLSAFAVWQGGFSPMAGVLGFALVTGWYLWRHPGLTLPMAASAVIALGSGSLLHLLLRGPEVALPDGILLTTAGGAPVTTESWRGQPMVINLWATWCPPCRREMPMMAEVAATETAVDLHFVNQGEGAGAVRRYLAQSGVAIAPVLDPGSAMLRHFGTMGLPTTLFIGADGRLHAAHMGEMSRAQLLAGIEALKENE